MLQRFKAFTVLLCGIVIGICLNYVLLTRNEFSSKQLTQLTRSAKNHGENRGDKYIKNQGKYYGKNYGVNQGDNHGENYVKNFGEYYGKNHGNNHSEYYGENHGENLEVFHKNIHANTVDKLSESVRVLCMVMIYSKKSFKKAEYIKILWGNRCNILLFFYTEKDELLNNVVLKYKNKRGNTWGLTKEAFKYVYKHYYSKADWFLKVNTGSFIIMENLRYMLQNYNSTKALYFGHKMKTKKNESYMDGSGYVLSKEAVKRFAEIGLESKLCRLGGKRLEDVELGVCLKQLEVISGDSRDSMGRQRFLNKKLVNYFAPAKPINWNKEYYKTSLEASDNAILINHEALYLEYFIYHLKTYGITHSDNFTIN